MPHPTRTSGSLLAHRSAEEPRQGASPLRHGEPVEAPRGAPARTTLPFRRACGRARSRSPAETLVVSLSSEARWQRRTRDLQIGAWLAEALGSPLRRRGRHARDRALFPACSIRFWGYAVSRARRRGRRAAPAPRRLARRRAGSPAPRGEAGDDRTAVTFGDWGAPALVPIPRSVGAHARGLLSRMSLVGAPRWSAVHAEIRAALAAGGALQRHHGRAHEGRASAARTEDVLRAMQAVAADVLEAAGGKVEVEGSTAVGSDGGRTTDGTGISGGTHAVPRPRGCPVGRSRAARRRTSASSRPPISSCARAPQPGHLSGQARHFVGASCRSPSSFREFISGSDDLVTTHRLLGMRQREDDR